MITVRDHSTGLLFDRWSHIGPKRRKLLDTGWPGVFRKFLLQELPVERIAARFTAYAGRPSKELYTMLGTLILQHTQDLSDADVQHALAFDVEWHYALDIIDDSDASLYLSERTLRNYRKIVLEEELAPLIFGRLTDRLLKEFKVDATRQRLDSTHIQSNMRHLGRIRIFSVTIRKFLRALKRRHAGEFAATISKEFNDRYLAKDADGCFSRVKPSESSRTLEELSRDLLFLIETFSSSATISDMPEYRLLERVLREQCTVTGTGAEAAVTVKPSKAVSPDSLQNPSDPDAGYDAHKGQGYQAQLMETYQAGERDPKIPNLITYVEVEPAHKHDSPALLPALDAAGGRDCRPEHLVCDTHYGSDENVIAAAEKGVTVVAPVAGLAPAESITLAHFSPDLHTGYVIRCPEGHAPLSMYQTQKHRFIASFRRKTCQTCPRQGDCPVKLQKKAAYLRYTLPALRCACRRAKEHTPEFREEYRWRAGVEGTNSHLKLDLGMGRLRVRGLEAVRLAVTFKALGLNIMRCARALAARLCDSLAHFPDSFTPKSRRYSFSDDMYSRIRTLLQKSTLLTRKTHFAA